MNCQIERKTKMENFNKLYAKTIIWNGDSICAGSTVAGCWANRIAERNNMTYKNYAVGGGTIAEGLPLMKSGRPRHSVSLTLDKMYEEYPDADYIIIEGGTNDADLLGPAVLGDESTRLGSFDITDFSGEYDRTTFCGALESIFYRATKYWMGKKIAYIVAHKMGISDSLSYKNRRFYFNRAVEICKKWGIPYIDLWNGCYLNSSLPWMYDRTKTADENKVENLGFYYDSQHLTGRGYDFTADMIDSWLKSI